MKNRFEEKKVKIACSLGISLFLVILCFSGCQIPGGEAGVPDVYAAGYSADSSGREVPGYWKNGVWMELPALGAYPASVTSLVVSGTDIYAGGWCWSGSRSTTQAPGYWKNNVWTNCTAECSQPMVTSLVISGSNVYALGYYWTKSFYGLVQAPGYWKDGDWVGLPTPSICGASVTSLIVSGTDVYVGGSCSVTQVSSTSNSKRTVLVRRPGFWVNGTWTALADPGYGGTVSSLTASGGVLYAGGCCEMPPSQLDPQTSLSEAGYWKNGSWIALGAPAAGNPRVISLVVSGDDVYACGYDGSGPGYWKNGTWTALPEQAQVTSLAVCENDVYVAGSASSSGPGQPGYWKNGTWNDLAPMDGTKGGQAVSLVVVR